MTKPGARSYLTVKPPSTAWPTTPSGSSRPITARSRRYGRRRKASSPAAAAVRPTRPERTRLPNSMSAWVCSGGATPPPHCGQSGQPRPEPVRRTPAPVMTMPMSMNSAQNATREYCSGVSVGMRRTGTGTG